MTEKKTKEKKSKTTPKQTKAPQTKEEIGKKKEQEAKQNTDYPKVVITVPKNEQLRQEDETKKDDDRKTSDGTATDKDKFQTDPVPSGKPLPVNQEDQKVDNDEEFYVTISIDCLTVLQNMDNLEKGKEKYVGDGWILKTTKVKCTISLSRSARPIPFRWKILIHRCMDPITSKALATCMSLTAAICQDGCTMLTAGIQITDARGMY